MFKFDVYFQILKFSKSKTTLLVMVSYTPQYKHQNNQTSLSDFAEWYWVLYVPM